MKTTLSKITQMQFDFTTPKGQVIKKIREGRTTKMSIYCLLWQENTWAGCDFFNTEQDVISTLFS